MQGYDSIGNQTQACTISSFHGQDVRKQAGGNVTIPGFARSDHQPSTTLRPRLWASWVGQY
eukprot:151140-Pelagomonas_calceolata.AAC.4